MTHEEVKEGLLQCAKTLELDLPTNETDALGKAGLDSLDITELIMQIEKHFNIRIPDEAIAEDKWLQELTSKEIIEIIKQYLPKGDA